MDMPWAYAVRILTKIGLINGYPAGDKNTYVSFFKMTEIENANSLERQTTQSTQARNG